MVILITIHHCTINLHYFIIFKLPQNHGHYNIDLIKPFSLFLYKTYNRVILICYIQAGQIVNLLFTGVKAKSMLGGCYLRLDSRAFSLFVVFY